MTKAAAKLRRQVILDQLHRLLILIQPLKSVEDLTHMGLLLEKEVLLLKLAILSGDYNDAPGGVIAYFDEEEKISEKSGQSLPELLAEKLGDNDQRILELIKRKGEVDGIEIFNLFPYTSIRSIKRNIARLVNMGLIVRLENGKKPLYKLSI